MKSITAWIALLGSVLLSNGLMAAERKEIKLPDVPPELVKAMSTLSKAGEAKYFRFDSETATVMWRVEVQAQDQKKIYLIETQERVADGKTNVVVKRSDVVRPTK